MSDFIVYWLLRLEAQLRSHTNSDTVSTPCVAVLPENGRVFYSGLSW